jgi:prophage regulatory protein
MGDGKWTSNSPVVGLPDLAASVVKADRLISLAQVEHLVGMKSSAIYKRIAQGVFPVPVRLSARCTRWKLNQVQSWIASLDTGASK